MGVPLAAVPELQRSPRVHPSPRFWSTTEVKILVWLGIAMVICWGVLWLGVKMAVGAVHLLLLLGVVLIVWGFFHKVSAPG
jgi:Flp pilus assembly protein TadB